MNLIRFESWPDVLAYAKTGAPLFYQAPMDRYATQLYAGKQPPGYEVRARSIRIYPPGSVGRGRNRTSDPFTADSGHLDRFSHPVEQHVEETHEMQAKRTKPTRGGSSGGGNPRNSRQDSEQQHDEAMRVLRAEYYQAVRSLAQDVDNLVKNEGMDEGDALHQVVDGSYWVTYTHANFQVLMCSDHHDAYSEDFGQAPVEGSDINWAALAYAAMARDVSEQVQAEGSSVEEAPRLGSRAARRGR